jgi:hypothetical protein
VQGDGYAVEIAIPAEAGIRNEFCVVGRGVDRCLVKVTGGACGLQVEVEDGVGFRKEPSDLRRCVESQDHEDDQRHKQRGGDADGVESAFASWLHC